jgi:hypothetical protein
MRAIYKQSRSCCAANKRTMMNTVSVKRHSFVLTQGVRTKNVNCGGHVGDGFCEDRSPLERRRRALMTMLKDLACVIAARSYPVQRSAETYPAGPSLSLMAGSSSSPIPSIPMDDDETEKHKNNTSRRQLDGLAAVVFGVNHGIIVLGHSMDTVEFDDGDHHVADVTEMVTCNDTPVVLEFLGDCGFTQEYAHMLLGELRILQKI